MDGKIEKETQVIIKLQEFLNVNGWDRVNQGNYTLTMEGGRISCILLFGWTDLEQLESLEVDMVFLSTGDNLKEKFLLPNVDLRIEAVSKYYVKAIISMLDTLKTIVSL